MLVEEFAKKHDLCPAGHDMMRPFLKKTVRECWEDASLAARGTWVFWVASRASLDPKAIVRCVVKCAREIPPTMPDPSAASAILDEIEGWCDGRKSRDEVRAAGKTALAQSEAAIADDRSYNAWFGIYYAAKCVDATTNSPGASGAIARAMEKAGKGSVAEAEARYAAIVRSAISWSDLEYAIGQNKPSPLPRAAETEEIQERTEQLLAEYKKALAGTEAACAQLDGFCKEQKFSLDGVSRLLGADGADGVRDLVEAAVGSMTAADNRTETARPSEAPKAPKRGRMMV